MNYNDRKCDNKSNKHNDKYIIKNGGMMAGNGFGRAYQKTHPWIKFQLDTRKLSHKVWLLLGEAKSKCDHIQGAPLLPETIKKMFIVYLAKGALATTAIEGNTLTEEEVEKRISGELKLPPSKEYLGQEIDNVVNAVNLIAKRLLSENHSDRISIEDIKEYNKLILNNLPLNEGVIPGEIRTYSVGIADYRGAPPEDCEFLLSEYVDWLNDGFNRIEDRVIYGILKAIISHLYFVWIHPFGDGNGRTARLIEFQILLAAGVPSSAAQLLSNHYNATRNEYYRHLRLTSKSEEFVNEFIEYALQGFVDGLKTEIEDIQKEQLEVHWINHVHNVFKEKNSFTDKRQKILILELSKNLYKQYSFQEIRHVSPEIAEKYANVNDITIKRDIKELQHLNLLEIKEEKYLINYHVLNVYKIPVRRDTK